MMRPIKTSRHRYVRVSGDQHSKQVAIENEERHGSTNETYDEGNIIIPKL